MHDIEPFFNWRDLYVAEEDEQSPFYGKEYSEFEFSDTVYNYFIHPQWDNFGSQTLYLKILFVDYDYHFAIIELIGEWNDVLYDDFMVMKREVLDVLYYAGIYKYIFIAENVLNFHSGDDDYYEEWREELNEHDGWAVLLNVPEQTQYDFKHSPIQYYFHFFDIPQWRTFNPVHLYQFLDNKMLRLSDGQ